MLLYKDLLTGAELFTDSYKITVVDEVFYEVKGKFTTEKTEVDDSMFGGNKSAEDTVDDTCEDVGKSGCDIVLANRLREEQITKKQYQKYLKLYVKAIVKHLEKTKPEKVDDFKKKIAVAIKKVLERFDDFQFFCGEDCYPEFTETKKDPEAAEDAESEPDNCMLALLEYRGEQHPQTPYMFFLIEGLVEEKQ